MRKTFIKTLITLAEKDDSIYLLVNDTGFSFVEEFKDKFPDRFYNFGISEQAGMSMAAGMGLVGKKVFIYGHPFFLSLRCLEQIRNDVCFHNSNVKIIAANAKNNYKLGFSHDIPELIDVVSFYFDKEHLLCPENKEEVQKITELITQSKSPYFVYLNG